jgi:hypothetical protein
VIDRPNGPDYFLILDEAVIKRRFAGAKVTAEQLEDIIEVAQRPHIHIRIVPLARGADMAPVGSFIIVDLGEESDDSVLYREYYDRDELLHDNDAVEFHRSVFERLWGISRDETATLRAFIAEAAQLRSSLDNEVGEGSSYGDAQAP